MVTKLVPFYREQNKNKQGYTLFLDKQDNRVYKVIHGNSNQTIYWLLFFLALIILRSISSVNLPTDNLILISGLLIFEAIVGIFIGIMIYKQYYKNLKEVFYTTTVIEDYIEKGKKMLKIEVWLCLGLMITYIISIALFLYDKWLIWNLLSLFLIVLLSVSICALPRDRFKLYKIERNEA